MKETEMKEFTQKEIDEEAERLCDRIIIMRATEIVDNLMDYAMEHPDKSVLPSDYTDKLIECPECHSASILVPVRDSDEYEFDEEELSYTYICKDCGHKFDDPAYADILSYWFIDPAWAADLEKRGEHVIYTECTHPIWCRRIYGQSISQDGVFQHMAEESLKKKWLAPKNR